MSTTSSNNATKNISPRLKLKAFLKKIGIKSAEPAMQEQINELIAALKANFEKQDDVFILGGNPLQSALDEILR